VDGRKVIDSDEESLAVRDCDGIKGIGLYFEIDREGEKRHGHD